MRRAGGLLVLAGTSLGSESDAVIRAALRLARLGSGRVHAVHALEPPPLPMVATGFGLAEPYLAARARGRLREQLDRVGAAASDLAGDTVAIGHPGPVLRAAAERLDADLLVVAAAAAEPLPLQRVRSTAPFLIRQGGRPVVIVKGEMLVPPRRVLAALDPSPLATETLRCGLALVAGSEIDPAPAVVALHGGEGLATILAACERENPDLVLVGSHERSGWQRFRRRSVAEAVTLRVPCAVLVIPPATALAGAVGVGASSAS